MELIPPGSTAEPAVADEASKPTVPGARPSTLPEPTKESPTVDGSLNDMRESTLEHESNHGAPPSQMSTAGGSKAIPLSESEIGIDVRSWLPEPSDISPLGLAGSLFEAILSLCTTITQRVARTKHSRRLHNELERFFLWGDGFSALEGQLDEVLSKSSELRQTVLSALYELGKVVGDDLLRVVDVSTRSEGPDDSAGSALADLSQLETTRELQRLLEKTAIVLDAREATTDFESLSDDGSTSYDLDEIIDDVAIYIDCLMDLSPALESPVVDLEPGEYSHQEAETFDVSSSKAVAFCRRIRDRFPKMAKFLVERLGEANAARAVRLESLQERTAEQERVEVPCEPEESSYQMCEQIFSDSQPTMTRTYSTRQSNSIFDKPHLVPHMSRKEAIPEESQSFATFASFSTSYTTINEERRRVPPLPDEAADGRPFKCLTCHQTLTGITTRAAWKKHIFDDLQPYLCTIPSCTETKTLFGSSQAWATHESTHRGKDWTSSICLFCVTENSKNLSDATNYYKHVAEHMREVSLAVLPQNLDEDGDDSDGQAEENSLQKERGSEIGSTNASAVLSRRKNHISPEPGPSYIDSEIDTMETLLHNATLEAKDGSGKEWLPASDLDRICEPATVLRELQRSFGEPDAKRYTDYVCGTSGDTQNGGNSSRMIFAILVFITKVPNLPRFVEAELRDEHLPFLWLDDTKRGLYSPSSPYRKKALPCFRYNDISVMRLFYQAQWQLLVPFIARDSHDEVKEYQLYGDTIMPWTAFAANAHDTGFSQVRQVEIHKSHHTFHQHKAFALKTLLQDNPNLAADKFKSELCVFMKMRPENHLLELCATFKVKEKGFEIYSFLFPWADGGSLGELWTKQPANMLPGKAVTPRLFLRWIAEQCHGLATALRSMHDVRQQALKKVNPEDARGEEDDEYYGIHGDLKPENILHFSQLESPTGLGILKIADFGLTEFHTLGSRTSELRRNAPAPAPTYRAPELVVPGEYFSRKADIWALGCVFSQLMTWAVHGVKSVVDFDNLRKEERDYDETKGAHKFKLDTFFKATYFANHGVQTSVKESTQKWLDDLQRTVQSDKGENFLTDFGNLIRHDMLENDRNKRIGCESLVERLATFLTMEKGRPDDPYWNPDLPSFPQPSLNETMMPNSLKTRSNEKTPAEELNGGRTKKNQPAGFRVSFDLTGTLQED